MNDFETLQRLFENRNYRKIVSNLPQHVLFCQEGTEYTNIFYIIELPHNMPLPNEEQYEHMKRTVLEAEVLKQYTNVRCLTIFLTDNLNGMRQLTEADPALWIIDRASRALLADKGQIADMDGMREEIVRVLGLDDLKNQNAVQMRKRFELKSKAVTITLVLLNVFVFLLCTFSGSLLYNKGAISVLDIKEHREYYRIFSSMFLHGDINHLVSNMLFLYLLGEIIEKEIGHGAYITVYFFSGVMGSILSMYYELATQNYYSSVGASGAIFGLVGAMLVIVIAHKGHYRGMTTTRLVMAIALMIYNGATATDVNNIAHVGGLIGGFILMSIFYLTNRINKNRMTSGD